MTLCTIIQARMGSTRLPGKTLMKVGGVTILEHVLGRVGMCDADTGLVVVACPAGGGDNPIAELCERIGVPCYRSSEHDVLNRYQQAAANYGADLVLRVTADMPLMCPQLTANILGVAINEEDVADYIAYREVPLGLSPELITATALQRCWQEAQEDDYKEHVTLYAIEHPHDFTVVYLEPDDWLFDRHHWRLTLDTRDDLELLERLYANTGGALFRMTTRDVVEAVAQDATTYALATRPYAA